MELLLEIIKVLLVLWVAFSTGVTLYCIAVYRRVNKSKEGAELLERNYEDLKEYF